MIHMSFYTSSRSAAAQVLRLHQPRTDPPRPPHAALAQRLLTQPAAVGQAALARKDGRPLPGRQSRGHHVPGKPTLLCTPSPSNGQKNK